MKGKCSGTRRSEAILIYPGSENVDTRTPLPKNINWPSSSDKININYIDEGWNLYPEVPDRVKLDLINRYLCNYESGLKFYLLVFFITQHTFVIAMISQISKLLLKHFQQKSVEISCAASQTCLLTEATDANIAFMLVPCFAHGTYQINLRSSVQQIC